MATLEVNGIVFCQGDYDNLMYIQLPVYIMIHCHDTNLKLVTVV